MVIGLMGIFSDCYITYLMHRDMNLFTDMYRQIAVLLHLAYCCALIFFVYPIFRIHVLLVSRNELASEWKKNLNEVVDRERTGRGERDTPVGELSDDEWDERFESFVYSPALNRWDKGCQTNCWSFWCTPRCTSKQKG